MKKIRKSKNAILLLLAIFSFNTMSLYAVDYVGIGGLVVSIASLYVGVTNVTTNLQAYSLPCQRTTTITTIDSDGNSSSTTTTEYGQKFECTTGGSTCTPEPCNI